MSNCAFRAYRSEYFVTVDGSAGAKLKNGSWSGIVGMLVRGEIEVASMNLVMTPERQSIVDFTFPLFDTR